MDKWKATLVKAGKNLSELCLCASALSNENRHLSGVISKQRVHFGSSGNFSRMGKEKINLKAEWFIEIEAVLLKCGFSAYSYWKRRENLFGRLEGCIIRPTDKVNMEGGYCLSTPVIPKAYISLFLPPQTKCARASFLAGCMLWDLGCPRLGSIRLRAV